MSAQHLPAPAAIEADDVIATNRLPDRHGGYCRFAYLRLRAIREACRRFHDDENMDFRFFDRIDHYGVGVGFFVALGALRATVGQQVALLSAHYDINVEGDLASVLPRQDSK
jgi:hypothetical protein